MSNASTAVAQRGWEIFRHTEPRPTLDQVNAALEADGLESVSERTHKHYRKLERSGVADYLPINELDTRLKLQRRDHR
jgi:hypothetical protein